MHRRARHLKPKSLEASAAFDSRYISNVSDGITIQTWSDISGNNRNASQGTALRRPTYKIGIQGGNPILRFDGDDFYQASYLTGTSYTYYAIFKRTASPTNAFDNVAFIASAGIAGVTANNGRRWQLVYTNSVFAESSNVAADTTRSINNNFNIHSVTAPIGSGTKRYFLNGEGEQTSNVSTLAGVTGGSVNLTIGATSWNPASITWQPIGDMGLLMIFEQAHPAPLRRRLEHAAAFAFKIPCS